MERMTNGRMAHILSINTHRKEYPVVGWIEENIRSGKADPDLGTSCVNVIGEVAVRFIEQFEYEVLDGKVTQVICGQRAEPFFEDPTKPTRQEIDLLEVCDYNYHGVLKSMCQEILCAFRHPHSCAIDYHVEEAECLCGKVGAVNYKGPSGWQYYCGGSPRCCP